MLVELGILLYLPDFFNMIEISSKVFPASISLLECEVFPQLLVEELVDWRITVNTSSWIAVPVPDSSGCSTFLVNLDFEALLAESERLAFPLDMQGFDVSYLFSIVNAPKPAPTSKTSSS